MALASNEGPQSGAGSVGGSAHVPSVHRTELSGSLGGLARSPVVRNRGTKKTSETNEGERLWISRTTHWFRRLYRFRSLGEVRVALVRIAAKASARWRACAAKTSCQLARTRRLLLTFGESYDDRNCGQIAKNHFLTIAFDSCSFLFGFFDFRQSGLNYSESTPRFCQIPD